MGSVGPELRGTIKGQGPSHMEHTRDARTLTSVHSSHVHVPSAGWLIVGIDSLAPAGRDRRLGAQSRLSFGKSHASHLGAPALFSSVHTEQSHGASTGGIGDVGSGALHIEQTACLD